MGAIDNLEVRSLLSATIYTVNSVDSGTSGTGTSGTLPYVISLANTNTNTDGSEIEFDPNVFSASSPGTITLASVLTLSETDGPEVINGPGAAIVTVSVSNAVQVFSVVSGVTATISGLTITGGNAAGFYGGGGVLNSGTANVSQCVISGNSTGFNLGGGGISNFGSMEIVDSVVSGNTSSLQGGGVSNRGTLTVSGTTINDNVVRASNYGPAFGGAIYSSGDLSITESVIDGNFVYAGNGNLVYPAFLVLQRSPGSPVTRNARKTRGFRERRSQCKIYKETSPTHAVDRMAASH